MGASGNHDDDTTDQTPMAGVRLLYSPQLRQGACNGDSRKVLKGLQ